MISIFCACIEVIIGIAPYRFACIVFPVYVLFVLPYNAKAIVLNARIFKYCTAAQGVIIVCAPKSVGFGNGIIIYVIIATDSILKLVVIPACFNHISCIDLIIA